MNPCSQKRKDEKKCLNKHCLNVTSLYVTNSFPFSCQESCSEVVVIEDLSSIAFSTGWGFKGGFPFWVLGMFLTEQHIFNTMWFDRHIVPCNLQLKLYVVSASNFSGISKILDKAVVASGNINHQSDEQMQTIYICKAMWGMFTSLHCLKDLAFDSMEQLSHFVWHSFEIQSRCSLLSQWELACCTFWSVISLITALLPIKSQILLVVFNCKLYYWSYLRFLYLRSKFVAHFQWESTQATSLSNIVYHHLLSIVICIIRAMDVNVIISSNNVVNINWTFHFHILFYKIT